MNSPRITQCPKCETSFRVSDAQLKVARGAVRCGSCLHVFRASDYFLEEPEPQAAPQKDDLTQDMFTETPAQAAKNSAAEQDDFLIHDHAELDDELLLDDHEADRGMEHDLNEEFLSLNISHEDTGFFSDIDKNDRIRNKQKSDDDAWAEALLNDDEPEEEDPLAFLKQPAKPAAPQVRSQQPASLDNNLGLPAGIANIKAAPIELQIRAPHSKRQRYILAGLSLFSALLLVVQVTYFNFEQYAGHPKYRPWYTLVCDTIGCQMPPIADVRKIKSTASPQVSSHPKFADALTVDILFVNSAIFEQPFPLVNLSFTNRLGNVIASRTFSPREYLAGEAAGMSMMPPQVPIHIALEIQDPGEQASSYQVTYLAQ
ncbi:MAG: DUF3426 domain-containing protein [Oceanospirillaceae bacterium]|nr:DUF3426 domain-containing protein [Oceanospirillaceae bacterium]MCP5350928.1 DUF3426 domain-containing protein [Oceanospirillaceae bacterium]